MGDAGGDMERFARGMLGKHPKGSEAYDLARGVLRLMEERDDLEAGVKLWQSEAIRLRAERDELARWKAAAEAALDEAEAGWREVGGQQAISVIVEIEAGIANRLAEVGSKP